ncbi:benzoate 4-monooxygenase cytochrome P450 [Mytilinidion resinicola]|uniref:Benzoate 4-monooxygenase cytochrome P450 n=1 Tax=Mytilinidion resinicola TaxID=574789 RepID=A0A6A6Z7P7_9PEZI|nr:benzoate 4-monooxygenase cytochrome P450 [Mytilinidion resinicola]KAF2816759.1 benzoate 4-monooxygenase cytochrome P450 [Mytilinidion resinicola]
MFVTIVSIYRVTLHPLAKYPGPLSYKLSNWPLIFQCIGGNRHIYHLQDHEKYGSVVRIGPNMLSYNTETALNVIYGGQKTNVRKSEWYRTIDAGSGAFSAATEIDKKKHAVRRRFISHSFSTEALRNSEPFIQENVARFCEKLAPNDEKKWSEKKDMARWCTWLGFDIMGDLAFGRRFNCLDSEENRYIPTAISSASKYMYYFPFLPGAWLLAPIMNSKLMEYVGGQSVTDNIRLVNYAATQLQFKIEQERADKEKANAPRKDMMQYLLNAEDPKTGLRPTPEELLADSVLYLAAGSDTVATSLAASFFYLVHNPLALAKATAEVRAAFKSADEIKAGKKLDSLAYLHGVMDETMRRCPPKPSHVPREVMPGGITIDGEQIPAGTVVGVPAYAIHHNPDCYPDPWSFNPERWIVNEAAGVSAESVALTNHAFCPFSLGIRGCIGKTLAYVEYKITLAHVLLKYDIRQAEGETEGEGNPDLEEGRKRVDEYQIVDVMGVIRSGPMVEFKLAQR